MKKKLTQAEETAIAIKKHAGAVAGSKVVMMDNEQMPLSPAEVEQMRIVGEIAEKIIISFVYRHQPNFHQDTNQKA